MYFSVFRWKYSIFFCIVLYFFCIFFYIFFLYFFFSYFFHIFFNIFFCIFSDMFSVSFLCIFFLYFFSIFFFYIFFCIFSLVFFSPVFWTKIVFVFYRLLFCNFQHEVTHIPFLAHFTTPPHHILINYKVLVRSLIVWLGCLELEFHNADHDTAVIAMPTGYIV